MKLAMSWGLLGTVWLLALAGCEPVDDGAATRAQDWNGVLSDNVVPGDRGVFVDVDETMTVKDGCAKTTLDAMQILKDNCASCHDEQTRAQAPPSEGCDSMGPAATFGFVLNPAKMRTETWYRNGTASLRYLVAGHANESAIYLRAVIDRNMPPLISCPESPFYPRINFSAGSVLQQWIDVCM